MKSGRMLAVVTALLLWGGAAGAQTIYGAGGLLIHPTALPPRHGLQFNLSYLNTQSGGEQDHYIPANLTYGFNDRLAVGLTYLNRVDDGRNRASGGLNARYILTPDGPSHPAVGLAGSFLLGDFRRSSLAIVASHAFASRGRQLFTLHAGVQWILWQHGPFTDDDLTEYVGASIPLGGRFALLGELGTRADFDAAGSGSVGVQWTGRDGSSIGIGYVNIGRSRDGGFFFGVGYPLGGFK